MTKEIDPDRLRELVRQGLRRPRVAAAFGISVRTLDYLLAASEELRIAATPERKALRPLERPVMKRCREGNWRTIRRVSMSKRRARVFAGALAPPAPSTGKPGIKPLAIDLQLLTSLISEGATLIDTASALGVSRATFLRRRRMSPEVRCAVAEGRRLAALNLSDARLILAQTGHWPAARLSMLMRVSWIEAGFGIRGASGVLNSHLRAIYSGWQG